MTLSEFYQKCVLPLMAEKASAAAAYAEQYVGVINAVLCEIFALNNELRMARGREEIPEFRMLAASDELEYETDLLISCAAYGCAARLYVDEAGDEANMVGFLESNYEAGKARLQAARWVDTVSPFGASI